MRYCSIEDFLRQQGICDTDEDYNDVINRASTQIAKVEKDHFGTLDDSCVIQFNDYCKKRMLCLGSPILMSIGRKERKSLASCAAMQLPEHYSGNILKMIEEYYLNNMGIGFNLSPFCDPVGVLRELNKHADEVAAKNSNIRFIGNMAILDYDHPDIFSFITCKQQYVLPHFNLSVNLSERFFQLHESGQPITFRLKRYSTIEFIETIADSIYCSAEPGMVFLDRINQNNIVPSLGKYFATAPCAEIGMVDGDLCMFGYINISSFYDPASKRFDCRELRNAVRVITQILDDCIELQLDSSFQYNAVIRQKRRIAIGVCGFADLLDMLQIPYGSDQSIKLLQDILLLINYCSKLHSSKLAEARGSFEAFPQSEYRNKHYLETKFGNISSSTISTKDWTILDEQINKHGIRNSSTTAIPPSGRTSYLLEASPSIEPHFSNAVSYRQTYSHTVIGGGLTATEISAVDHLRVLDAATQCIDEGVSKTINLREDCTREQITKILLSAIEFKNITGIAIYRDRSLSSQPFALNS